VSFKASQMLLWLFDDDIEASVVDVVLVTAGVFKNLGKTILSMICANIVSDLPLVKQANISNPPDLTCRIGN
jgi:hypothetical protein